MDVTIPCLCPETPHETDTVTLRDRLNFHQATTITKAIQFIESDDERTRSAEILATLSEFYVLMGVEGWTIRDAKGKPVVVTQAAIREHLLERVEAAAIVVEAADQLYQAAVLLPLVARASNSSPPSSISDSTSKRRSGQATSSPRPSKRSSTSITQTDVTEMTSSSLDGVSKSSLISESAA